MDKRQHVVNMLERVDASREKYSYFQLGAAGACIAFALTQSKDQVLGLIHIPLGLALLLWGLSFYFGSKSISLSATHTSQDAHGIAIAADLHQDSRHLTKEERNNVVADNFKTLKDIGEKILRLQNLQTRTLIVGAACFVIGQVVSMLPACIKATLYLNP
ncbi:hypothetical protein HLB01_05555 [Bordetella trematum]|uniref:hypothetical protein n=1 Tax=Bordetella trematum TaxID=123899 RepID=UPI000F8DD025|nr:hypothetical protein [Bordetella trematum]NNH18505.1 hypothetical protein [Bordetella trematum]